MPTAQLQRMCAKRVARHYQLAVCRHDRSAAVIAINALHWKPRFNVTPCTGRSGHKIAFDDRSWLRDVLVVGLACHWQSTKKERLQCLRFPSYEKELTCARGGCFDLNYDV
ncbi:hypothetical protein P692DRAFT_20371916 [Suillus brevipes Sb2]|nr:hypothetical protein P692DRAFT_20371916 [Suillus brevipes Sb2]